MYSLLRVPSSLPIQNISRLLHSTSMVLVDMKWRRRANRPLHVMNEPEFIDRPDYSFLDGRPTPVGKTVLERYEDEKRLCADAIKYIGEIDYALERLERLKVEEKEKARAILSRKLKPKGPMYKPKHDIDEE